MMLEYLYMYRSRGILFKYVASSKRNVLFVFYGQHASITPTTEHFIYHDFKKINVMEQDAQHVLRRITITMPIFFLIGIWFFFFGDAMIGIAFLVGTGIGLLMGINAYRKLKKNDPLGASKSRAQFSLGAGAALIILGLIVFLFEREHFAEVSHHVGMGILFLLYGAWNLQQKERKNIRWKDIPTGFKIIVIYLIISILVRLLTLGQGLESSTFFLGMIVQVPLSALVTIIHLIIPIVMLFLIQQRTGWKILLGLYAYTLLNGMSNTIAILSMPAQELFIKLERPIPDVAPEALETAKNLATTPILLGVIAALAILIYIYNKKEYFEQTA